MDDAESINVKDPREPRIAGWEGSVPLYPLKLSGALRGTVCVAGTNYPAPQGKHAFVVHLELTQPLGPREARRLMAQVYRAVLSHSEQNQAWAGAAKLGGEDQPSALPWSKPGTLEAHCFWMMLSEYPRPVLAFRTHYESKEALKRIFSAEWKAADGKETVVKTGWKPEAKVWWAYAEHAYPRLLGQLRAKNFKLVWIQRQGFPPAPLVEGTPE